MNHIDCADCGYLGLQSLLETETFQYKGQSLTVDVDYCRCPICGAETILPAQIERNDCRLRDAWRKADGLMTGVDIGELRNKLRLSVQEAGKIFGVSPEDFARYESGAAMQSEELDKLMRLALEDKPVMVLGWLRERSRDVADSTAGGQAAAYRRAPAADGVHP
jgi:HTH-type transcriptional regulator/antitoxin MqsA